MGGSYPLASCDHSNHPPSSAQQNYSNTSTLWQNGDTKTTLNDLNPLAQYQDQHPPQDVPMTAQARYKNSMWVWNEMRDIRPPRYESTVNAIMSVLLQLRYEVPSTTSQKDLQSSFFLAYIVGRMAEQYEAQEANSGAATARCRSAHWRSQLVASHRRGGLKHSDGPPPNVSGFTQHGSMIGLGGNSLDSMNRIVPPRGSGHALHGIPDFLVTQKDSHEVILVVENKLSDNPFEQLRRYAKLFPPAADIWYLGCRVAREPGGGLEDRLKVFVASGVHEQAAAGGKGAEAWYPWNRQIICRNFPQVIWINPDNLNIPDAPDSKQMVPDSFPMIFTGEMQHIPTKIHLSSQRYWDL
ncbi:hypothetical protein C8T65DRAFT_696109 [Cerioporus squamosus]|nr:hypothetical protein C8T65DRAFT_696109 [Cerioporus squamosus]